MQILEEVLGRARRPLPLPRTAAGRCSWLRVRCCPLRPVGGAASASRIASKSLLYPHPPSGLSRTVTPRCSRSHAAASLQAPHASAARPRFSWLLYCSSLQKRNSLQRLRPGPGDACTSSSGRSHRVCTTSDGVAEASSCSVYMPASKSNGWLRNRHAGVFVFPTLLGFGNPDQSKKIARLRMNKAWVLW